MTLQIRVSSWCRSLCFPSRFLLYLAGRTALYGAAIKVKTKVYQANSTTCHQRLQVLRKRVAKRKTRLAESENSPLVPHNLAMYLE